MQFAQNLLVGVPICKRTSDRCYDYRVKEHSEKGFGSTKDDRVVLAGVGTPGDIGNNCVKVKATEAHCVEKGAPEWYLFGSFGLMVYDRNETKHFQNYDQRTD